MPQLAPGAHLLRLRDHRWQVGLDPAHRVLLPPSAEEPDPQGSTAGPTAGALLASGIALPLGTGFGTAIPSPGRCPPPVRHTLAALARETGADCAAVLARRARHAVAVETFGPPLSTPLGHELRDLCARTGLSVPEAAHPAPRSTRPPPASTVVALVGVGEPSREQVDAHLRGEVPHLLLSLVEGRAVVGPFVVPGLTPCLRCTDAVLTDADASWPLLVEQYARAVRTERQDGVPEPVDAALASLALAWAARDLATFAEGGTPTTLATTIELAPRLETVETRHWSPHPRCGCSWG